MFMESSGKVICDSSIQNRFMLIGYDVNMVDVVTFGAHV